MCFLRVLLYLRVEGRQNKHPMMSDLSQSGILEMVADNIILAGRNAILSESTNYQPLALLPCRPKLKLLD
ncbi:hypothetical protein NIES4074_56570 [Cylindrospermum sp. NIES-4074]|nr:hypothetical protein NIES4074_56570 [Cylindrospermum sp. NIES-4074]